MNSIFLQKFNQLVQSSRSVIEILAGIAKILEELHGQSVTGKLTLEGEELYFDSSGETSSRASFEPEVKLCPPAPGVYPHFELALSSCPEELETLLCVSRVLGASTSYVALKAAVHDMKFHYQQHDPDFLRRVNKIPEYQRVYSLPLRDDSEEFDIKTEIENLAQAFERFSALELFPEPHSHKIRSVRSLVRVILENLLSNAIRHGSNIKVGNKRGKVVISNDTAGKIRNIKYGTGLHIASAAASQLGTDILLCHEGGKFTASVNFD